MQDAERRKKTLLIVDALMGGMSHHVLGAGKYWLNNNEKKSADELRRGFRKEIDSAAVENKDAADASQYLALALGGMFSPKTPLRNVSFESKMAPGYNAPIKSSRGFETDYPHAKIPQNPGILAEDMEGRAITAPFISGRKSWGGMDEAIPAEKFDALSEGLYGVRPQGVPPGQIGGAAGKFFQSHDDLAGKKTYAIKINNKLPPDKAFRTGVHEIGHGIDELAGSIDQRGIKDELAAVFSELNNPSLSARAKAVRPEHLGYSTSEAPAELMAEALRAYMTNPNYLKTVAPNVAARIRASVNSNPRLAKWIQFNSLAGLGVFALPENEF